MLEYHSRLMDYSSPRADLPDSPSVSVTPPRLRFRTKDKPMAPRSFTDLYQEAEEHDDYWVAGTVLELTEAVTEIMERDGISCSKLARRLGTSPAYVTKMLRGNANFTLATMSRLARALGADLQIQLLTPAKSDQKTDARPRHSRGGSSPPLHGMVAAARRS